MSDPIEYGESRELEPARLSAVDPETLIAVASKWATALKAVVEKQKLYALISGKKYPQVEAWMIVGRMDNTVAQEESVVRGEDGSYVATAILVRLSDGSIVGRASALCGAPDDRPWNGRPEYNRRSMAVTRAISRAFRAQYSWIMALAGYEPTPAEEMPAREPQTARTVTSAAEPVVSEAAVAELTGVADPQIGASTASSGTPTSPMTLTEIQRRAKAANLTVTDLNRKATELYGRTINLLTSDERLAVAIEEGLA